MAGFQDILGHEQVREQLQKAIRHQRVSHAYILSGERGMGKKTLAKAFAMTLLCEKGGDEPCMVCHSCKQLLSDNHPDVIWVRHDKPASIGVDDIRLQVNDTIAIRPYNGSYKIYMIDEAEKMTVQAQNALLKTIEEPPEYAVLMLLTTNSQLFLPTIRSRCMELSLKPLMDRDVAAYLEREMRLDPAEAQLDAAFARGNLGRAREIAGSETFAAMTADLMRLVEGIHRMETPALLDKVSQMVKDYPDLTDCLDLLQLWYRDVLMFKATKDMNALIFKQAYRAVNNCCKQSSYQGLEQILEAIDKARIRLGANVSKELTLELLLLTMKEN